MKDTTLKALIKEYEESIEKWRKDDMDEWDRGYTCGAEDVINRLKGNMEA